MRLIVSIIVLLAIFVTGASAERIKLKNGKVYEGEIIEKGAGAEGVDSISTEDGQTFLNNLLLEQGHARRWE